MGKSERIKADDVRGLLTVVGEVSELRNDPQGWRHHLLVGLRRLLQADVAMIVTGGHGGGEGTIDSYVDEGFANAARRRVYLRFLLEEPLSDPFAMAMTQLVDRRKVHDPITRARHELVPDRRWYGHPHVEEVRRAAGVDHCAYSLFVRPARKANVAIGVHRRWGDPRRFASRETTLLDLCHGQLRGIYRSEVKTHLDDQTLSPRLRETLTYLLAGRSEKEIADRMALSRHTIHDYVKALYRHFAVYSRGELLAKFIA